ncbi:RNA methyltransferase related protein [Methanococcus maripaludis C5]|uniref:RNA methyltransferase related protein n=1 Tax=Methanococcus maripaludis (strain C5 / ATCC BAA-1333) TaxID=402880 RepID=A4FY33_METM5|nr:50S ribosomal protein L11 methyltransferase [Methanococcus maripaludis]ABO35117.1 RNA methyltransferase related protein [Methanococcus maripaludis C5]
MLSKGAVINKLRSYKPCKNCNGPISKTISISDLKLNNRKRKCECGNSQLDDVMLDVLNLMVEFDEFQNNDLNTVTLRDAGTPLVEIGYPLKYLPVVSSDELIVMKDVSKPCAKEILKIPEVKGVISNNSKNTGLNRADDSCDVNSLIAGDDFRCDIFVLKSIMDCVVICKNQSKVHIEFPRPFNPKIAKIDRLNLNGKVVIDGFCGSGTLGLAALKKGAKKVIFSDINSHALKDVIYNLKLNFSKEVFERIEIINSDFLNLDIMGDVCFVDLFPHMNREPFLNKAKTISKQVVLI